MSIRYSVQVTDVESGSGNDNLKIVSGATVQLYDGPDPNVGVDPVIETFTENNNDGLYYCDVDDSGVYTIVVNGAIQTALNGIRIDADEGWFENTLGSATVIKLTNESGETTYTWPNTTQDGVVTDSSKPT